MHAYFKFTEMVLYISNQCLYFPTQHHVFRSQHAALPTSNLTSLTEPLDLGMDSASYLSAAHKHETPDRLEPGRLTPPTPDDLTIDQSEDRPRTDHTPATPPRSPRVFKTLSLKAFRESGPFKSWLPGVRA